MNTLVIVIIAVVLALCVGFAIGRMTYARSNSNADCSRFETERKTEGGAATALLTDEIKKATIMAPTGNGHNIVISDFAWHPDAVYHHHLEIYAWKCGSQVYIKCGVEGSATTEYDMYYEMKHRLKHVVCEPICHVTIVRAVADPIPTSILGLQLTFYEQIGHALIWLFLKSRTASNIFAISHNDVSDHPKGLSSSKAECFSANGLVGEVYEEIAHMCVHIVSQIIQVWCNDFVLGHSECNNTVNLDHKDSQMFLSIYNASVAANAIIQFLFSLSLENLKSLITGIKWAVLWHALCEQNEINADVVTALISQAETISGPWSFSYNGAYNLLNANLDFAISNEAYYTVMKLYQQGLTNNISTQQIDLILKCVTKNVELFLVGDGMLLNVIESITSVGIVTYTWIMTCEYLSEEDRTTYCILTNECIDKACNAIKSRINYARILIDTDMVEYVSDKFTEMIGVMQTTVGQINAPVPEGPLELFNIMKQHSQ